MTQIDVGGDTQNSDTCIRSAEAPRLRPHVRRAQHSGGNYVTSIQHRADASLFVLHFDMFFPVPGLVINPYFSMRESVASRSMFMPHQRPLRIKGIPSRIRRHGTCEYKEFSISIQRNIITHRSHKSWGRRSPSPLRYNDFGQQNEMRFRRKGATQEGVCLLGGSCIGTEHSVLGK